jgi:hypothetical protein
MGPKRVRLLSIAVAIAILAVGGAYAATRSTEYTSSASLLLAPAEDTSPDVLSSLLDSFQRSGTSGTYVELVSSKDTARRAGIPGNVSVAVRAVPDARTIQAETTGPENRVQPALTRLIRASQERESELGDVWKLQVLQTPSDPEVAGVGRNAILAATVLLALLAGILTTVLLGRYRFIPVVGQEPAELAAGTAGAGVPVARVAGPAREAPALEQPAEVRVHLELESFRYVKASPTTVLLQVTGYWRSELPRQLATATLLLHDGRRMHPIAPLSMPENATPSAGPDTPLWRASYAAPVEIFERSERIALRAGPGVVVGLPNPVEQSLLHGQNGGAPEHEEVEAEVEAEVEVEAEAEEFGPEAASDAEVEAETEPLATDAGPEEVEPSAGDAR